MADTKKAFSQAGEKPSTSKPAPKTTKEKMDALRAERSKDPPMKDLPAPAPSMFGVKTASANEIHKLKLAQARRREQILRENRELGEKARRDFSRSRDRD